MFLVTVLTTEVKSIFMLWCRGRSPTLVETKQVAYQCLMIGE